MSADRSTRPYLIRALHEWALDSGFTPQIAVDATVPGVQVPHAFVKDGQIVLNVHPQSVHQLELGNETISFFARFGGKSEPVVVPVLAVLAVYARENGRGIQFPAEEGGVEPPPTAPEPPTTSAPRKGAHLKRVK
ncbi:MAG TPA: ClpXP protease specificity-enhancing factor [Acidiferrobacterales bacterium]|nr:ClpXP protease specificity-enhancing factor [Acidiferrobacterales bacterium]